MIGCDLHDKGNRKKGEMDRDLEGFRCLPHAQRLRGLQIELCLIIPEDFRELPETATGLHRKLPKMAMGLQASIASIARGLWGVPGGSAGFQ
jgi:hypothetical protein